MPAVLGPITVTPAPFQLAPPSGDNTTYDRVIIANHSQYLLIVDTFANIRFLHPWTADVFDYSTARPGVRCSPQLISTLIVGASSYCVATFLNLSDPSPGSFPQEIQSPIDAALAVAQAGVSLQSLPELIDSQTIAAVPYTSNNFDVSTYSSFIARCWCDMADAGPPAKTSRVTLLWFDNTFSLELGRQTYEINSENSTDCGQTCIIDNMMGPQMRYMFESNTGRFHLFGSHQPIANSRAFETGPTAAAGQGTDRLLISTGSLNVPAASTVQKNIRLGPGPAYLSGAYSSGGPCNVRIYPPLIGTGCRIYSRTLNSLDPLDTMIVMPRRACTLFLQNTHATIASTFTVALIAAGDG